MIKQLFTIIICSTILLTPTQLITAATIAPFIEPLTTTKWGQGSPYNKATPLLGGQQTYPGCAAIAVAQIVKFHRNPQQGQGKVSYWWDLGSQYLSVDFSSYTFNFNQMPNTLTGASRAEKSNLTDFIYRIGVGLHAEFGTEEGTEASGKIIENLLRYNLNYGKSRRSMYSVSKSAGDWVMYSDTEWLNMIKVELNKGRPVLYMAQSQDGTGHVFIIDGYNQNDEVHVNWGWSGTYNGYYQLNEMNPDPNYPNEKWIVNPTMFIGLEPKETQAHPSLDVELKSG
ncbi:C10 family peptidase [Endozoicomonas sp. SM1973]|uniref:C10 family peptidase n=1 Tax=Spartinivicinus marinus TaxID=2994442 RepID=A0A853I1W1_9GAMM|nr:C10 family peptidase [Spartinivicinus marinus]MCX4026193.1 C10 family peptidase [Spartinivicinus marinus]NYZ67393.1 C10 family peptidase [Spartinivicinus marinus]